VSSEHYNILVGIKYSTHGLSTTAVSDRQTGNMGQLM